MKASLDEAKFASWLEKKIKLNPLFEQFDDAVIRLGVDAFTKYAVELSNNVATLDEIGLTVEP